MMPTTELFLVSVVVLVLVLMVLVILCCILRYRTRNLTELEISAGQPACVLIIRTEADHARQMLDNLLERVFVEVEPGPRSGEEPREGPAAEPGEDLGGELGSDSGSNTVSSRSACLPSRAINTLQNKLRKWFTNLVPPAGAETDIPPCPPPPPPSPSPPPANKDEIDDLDFQWLEMSPCCSAPWEEKQHDESQV